jgi:peptidoglycan/LPS O-acetylase OafA/YrhL
MSADKRGSVYFPGLNGIRFIAAFSVIIHHVEQMKYFLLRRDHLWQTVPIENLGRMGVSLFFVLSGFLITYLLLAEKRYSGTVSVKEFYWRRILRIWPLYYLVIGLSFFCFPFVFGSHLFLQTFSNYDTKLMLYVFFLPNVARVWSIMVWGAAQAWSVGVEEQFYLVWPWIVKYVKRGLPLIFFACVAFKFLIYNYDDPFFAAVSQNFPAVAPAAKFLIRFARLFGIEMLAMGALGAYAVFFERKSILKIIFHPLSQVAALAAALTFLFNDFESPYYLAFLQPAVFAVLIINVACNPRPLWRLEDGFYNYLGKISYGIYMYHTVVIFVVLKLLLRMKFIASDVLLFNVSAYALTFGMTVLVSGLSYRYFESYFLKLKKKHQIVASGGQATAS